LAGVKLLLNTIAAPERMTKGRCPKNLRETSLPFRAIPASPVRLWQSAATPQTCQNAIAI